MITKEEFFSMTESDAINYINDTFYIEDVNEVSEDFLTSAFESGMLPEYQCEEDIKEYLEDHQPFGFIIENFKDEKLREILWTEIVEQCEEVEE